MLGTTKNPTPNRSIAEHAVHGSASFSCSCCKPSELKKEGEGISFHGQDATRKDAPNWEMMKYYTAWD